MEHASQRDVGCQPCARGRHPLDRRCATDWGADNVVEKLVPTSRICAPATQLRTLLTRVDPFLPHPSVRVGRGYCVGVVVVGGGLAALFASSLDWRAAALSAAFCAARCAV
jgi:hypothetical protein